MFRFGVDYYPEHWPEARWETDARLMQEAGFNTVRLAEFAWSRLEPARGHFDFDWLDRAIGILHARGMQVVLGTPTASPPPWVMAAWPDAYRVSESGQRITYGNRRGYCPTHAGYRERSRIITAAMAEHYADHPAVIGWQTDNEFGDRCFCPQCQAAFQTWVRHKYGDLDAVNAAWGTIFWSHVYTEWSQIPAPLATATALPPGLPPSAIFAADGSHNPGLALDYYRFMSDTYVAFQREQVDILRRLCPEHFITHNLMGFHFDKLNYFDLADDLDFVSWDNYRRMQWTFRAHVEPSEAGLAHAAMRGLKQKNFWVMEQQAGPGGWQIVSVAPRPGELRQWAYQSIAHGADGVIFFRWRTARHGAEQYWHGLLEHDARPGRRYQEIKQMGAELKALGPAVLGSEVRAEVAMLLDYDSRFAFQIQANNPNFSYPAHFQAIYAAFHRRNVAVDVVAGTADLARYKLVVAPAYHVLPEAVAAALEAFVMAGGVLLVTPRTGVKDAANAVVELPLPGLLASLCGVQVEEYDSLPAEANQVLEPVGPALAPGGQARAAAWCDVLRTDGAEVVARFTQDYYAGAPVVTCNRVGAGRAVYVATFGTPDLYAGLTEWLFGLAGVQPGWPTPEGVEVCTRWQGDRPLYFVINHNDTPCTVELCAPYYEQITGQALAAGAMTLSPHQVAVLASA